MSRKKSGKRKRPQQDLLERLRGPKPPFGEVELPPSARRRLREKRDLSRRIEQARRAGDSAEYAELWQKRFKLVQQLRYEAIDSIMREQRRSRRSGSHRGAARTDKGRLPKPQLLPWKVLPPGEIGHVELIEHYERLKKAAPHRKYDLRRLRKMLSLSPNQCFVGIDKFRGYVVFTFGGTDRVILENPREGNAVYVLRGDWQQLSKLTKQELLSRHADSTTRVIHRGSWFARLRRQLRS